MSEREGLETSLNAERLLGLRRFPGMAQIELQEAGKLLAAMTERVIASGEQISASGTPLSSAWFVVDGELVVSGAGPDRRIRAGETFGMLEMLAEVGEGAEVECVSDALVLEIAKDDLIALLAEEFELLHSAIRQVNSFILEVSPMAEADIRAELPPGPRPLAFVDRLIVLYELSSFSAGGAEMLVELASAMTELSVAGVVALAGDIPESLSIVIDGCLHYGGVDFPVGSSFGVLHSVAESALAFDVLAEAGTRVLSCPAQTMLDLLEDDVPLALTWLRESSARLFQLAPTFLPKRH